ncbi:nuclease [uncultured phage_MedDCM-OCT-S28-C10]|uniref:Nuclease n=1 Tax=uncultured phage_MedDCM-OCT-S28-C10 TaxID=2741077 RepID=A0A6S4P9P3_9CAUD|nr:exonuclease [uncultured phage_MedDCM-OCT-S28-C10]BAQ94092.1 nuclease [uncultured phage_MedDCM-OCT-S28-C10]BAR25294.1 exonuclease [uncultured Mediterranean phage uvMED]BAR25349.1 exonuclease [uncultured Mediterranean phage uvMED]
MPKSKLLIDGDIIAYQITSQIEEPIHWGNDLWTLHSDFRTAKDHFHTYIKTLKENLYLSDITIFLSDGSKNFRKQLYPDYKANRKNKRKPTCLPEMRKYMIEEFGAITEPRLEADDLLGIYSTKPSYKNSIVVSLDKDLRTIPGKLSPDGSNILKITKKKAIYNHATQILIGDTTDNYPGCPGIGPKTAAKLFADIEGASTIDPYWAIILKTYNKAGLTESDALTQARISYILQSKDYDFKNKKIKLWKPFS